MNWTILFNGFRPHIKCNPILGAALSTVGSLASSLASQSSQESQNEQARAWQEKMWNKTNEYNSPKNQRRLYNEAGYNPYLFGNEGSSVSGASNPGAPANQPLPKLDNPFGAGISAYSSMRNIEQRDTELALRKEELEMNRELTHMKAMESMNDQLIKSYEKGGQELYDKNFEMLKPQMEHFDWENSRSKQEFDERMRGMKIENDRNKLELELREKFGEKESAAKLKELDAITNKYKAEYDELMSRKDLNRKEIEALGARMARDMAEAGLLNSKSGEIQSLLPYTRSIFEDDSIRSDMDRQEKESEFGANKRLRKYKQTPWNQQEKVIEYSSEHNPVTDFMRGFTSAVPISPLGIGGSQGTKYYGREGSKMKSDISSKYLHD